MFEGKKHDGVSPIIFEKGKNTIELRTQFHQLFDYLVPSSGRAETAQGEIIRIAGRVQHEMLDNGCMNWDEDFNKMLKTIVKYTELEDKIQYPYDVKAAKRITNTLIKYGKQGICSENWCEALCQLAVDWVSKNPNIMAPLKANYNR
ncbi:MAG: hypothetical protein K2N63_08300 [Lachnospiraceae bacterium]|nr:hypothetical protein [Lachnospiraceae bacterium]